MNVGAAAIDIVLTMHMAAVYAAHSDDSIRAIGTFTHDLHDLLHWFASCGVTRVAMETTGVSWSPAFDILEEPGFEVILVIAGYAKNVPGRKVEAIDVLEDRHLGLAPVSHDRRQASFALIVLRNVSTAALLTIPCAAHPRPGGEFLHA